MTQAPFSLGGCLDFFEISWPLATDLSARPAAFAERPAVVKFFSPVILPAIVSTFPAAVVAFYANLPTFLTLLWPTSRVFKINLQKSHILMYTIRQHFLELVF